MLDVTEIVNSRKNTIATDEPTEASPLPCLENPVLAVRSTDRGYLMFLDKAAWAVKEFLNYSVGLIERETLGIGKWHPTGFATFDVASISGLGLLRLHFWPVGLRRALAGHPRIHRHDFQLYSRIIAGEYRESQYTVSELRDDSNPKGVRDNSLLTEFVVEPNRGDGIDRLRKTGRWFDVKPTFSGLKFPAGTWHEVEVGQFHSTPISKRGFCVTLALLGLPSEGASAAILGSNKFNTLSNHRAIVSEEDAHILCQQYKYFRKRS